MPENRIPGVGRGRGRRRARTEDTVHKYPTMQRRGESASTTAGQPRALGWFSKERALSLRTVLTYVGGPGKRSEADWHRILKGQVVDGQ